MYSSSHVRYSFKLLGGKVCFVISVPPNEDVVSCISLFGVDQPSFDTFQAVFQTQFVDKYKLKNEDPPDHDEIHRDMGAEMNVDPAETMSASRHFHWVCSLNGDIWPTLFLMDMPLHKWLLKKQAIKIVQAIQTAQALEKQLA